MANLSPIPTQSGRSYSIREIINATMQGRPINVNVIQLYDLPEKDEEAYLKEHQDNIDSEFDIPIADEFASRLEVHSSLLDKYQEYKEEQYYKKLNDKKGGIKDDEKKKDEKPQKDSTQPSGTEILENEMSQPDNN